MAEVVAQPLCQRQDPLANWRSTQDSIRQMCGAIGYPPLRVVRTRWMVYFTSVHG